MRSEIRTLLRAISTLVVLFMLVFGASMEASAQRRRARILGTRHDNGRHLGWTRGRHRGWTTSNHRGVGTDDSRLGDVFGRNRRDNRDNRDRRRGDDRDRDHDRNRVLHNGDGVMHSGEVMHSHDHGHGRGRH
jgi:hypothetical protein